MHCNDCSNPISMCECSPFGGRVRKVPTMAVVLVHPEWGIYLGNAMGLGFWSKLDPVGQPSAVTFPSERAAREHMATWDPPPVTGVTFHTVRPDDGEYATMSACVAAGLDGWEV